MLSLNEVNITGRIVREPELHHTAKDVAVCNVILVSNRRFRGKDGELRDEATFIEVVFWRKTAEKLVEFFNKGDPIYVEGRLMMDQWTNTEGAKRDMIKINASSWQFVEYTKKDKEDDDDEYEYVYE